MLTVDHVSVWLARKRALEDISLRAEAGQITAIVGPNGSGKTTLLRAITQELPYAGKIYLEGTEIGALRGWELAARRAVLPQASRIAFPFTVLEIVRLGLSAGATAAPDTRALEALARVGLSGFEGRYYQELSGGEQQRVQLARVLTQVWAPIGPHGPCWLLLDEPVSSLDIGHQLEVMYLAADYAARGGGVIAVMHDLNLTAMFAQQIILLASGHAIAQGPPAHVLTDDLLSRAYGCDLQVGTSPAPPIPYVLPQMARRTIQS